MTKQIEKSKLLVVEGRDEEKFFRVLLHHLNIREHFQIVSVDGKDNFRTEIGLMSVAPDFDQVESFVVIRDADLDAKAAFQSIKDIFGKYSLPCPIESNTVTEGSPTTGIYIMPGNSSEGMLESLCLKTVKNHPNVACVDAMFECVFKHGATPKNIHKARVQAFLATMPETVPSVGPGAMMKYWDFESEELTEIKEFLLRL